MKARRTRRARAARASKVRPPNPAVAGAISGSRDRLSDKRPYYDGPAPRPFMHQTLTVVLQILLVAAAVAIAAKRLRMHYNIALVLAGVVVGGAHVIPSV